MPAIQRSEFALALNQVSAERGIDPDTVLETVRNAILAAYRKDHPDAEAEGYSATLDSNSGEAKIFFNDKDVTPPGFGRIAAQTAKQVILQKIREKEKEAIMSDYRHKVGTVVNGMILRFAGPTIIVDIGKTEAIYPQPEQIPNERYHLNQRLAFYLLEIQEGLKGEEIVVSRANNGLLEGLFKREVPEVSQGSVEIRAIVREPGGRSKVAVYSTQSGIDPVGSCVGQKGVRVQAIIQELGGMEKIDIIQWSEKIDTYIQQALSPAKNLEVKVNEEDKIATVRVVPEELSLAIGKDGQNVRLASKLTGYRIEIEPTEEIKEEKKAESPTDDKPEEPETPETPEAPEKNEETPSEDVATETPAEETKTEETPAEETVEEAAKEEPQVETVEDTVETPAESVETTEDVKTVDETVETVSEEQVEDKPVDKNE